LERWTSGQSPRLELGYRVFGVLENHPDGY